MSAVTVDFQVPPNMLANAAPEKPVMLMVSHCLPQPTGDGDRRRSWQLLDAAAQTHRLWVAALADGPVHLGAWDAVAARCEQFVLLPRGRGGQRLRHLRRTVRSWCRATSFNAAMCTTADLSPIIEAQARWRICDMPGAAASRQSAAERWWRVWPGRGTAAPQEGLLTLPADPAPDAAAFTQVQGLVVLNVPHERSEVLAVWMQRIASGSVATGSTDVAQAA